MAISKRLRYEILRRDGNKCRYCGITAADTPLTIDHVVPSALGGGDEPSNLVAACGPCNSGKSASSTDAALVEGVSRDALRWAAAIRAAADDMLSDIQCRKQAHAEFDDAWSAWGSGDAGIPIPRQAGWEQSVDAFMAAGLPMPVLLDCLAKAMASQRVKPQDTFRYMCGIAWKRVTELQEAAKGSVAAPVDSPEPSPGVDYEAMYKVLMGEVFGALGGVRSDSDMEVMADQSIKGRHDDDDPLILTSEGLAAVAVVSAASQMLAEYRSGARDLLRSIPEFLNKEVHRDAVWTLLTADKVDEAILHVDGGLLYQDMVIARMIQQAKHWIDFSGVHPTPRSESDS
jgi:hypothetical protein